jgi:hypothetical protein
MTDLARVLKKSNGEILNSIMPNNRLIKSSKIVQYLHGLAPVMIWRFDKSIDSLNQHGIFFL